VQILALIGLYFLKCTKFDQLTLRKIIKIVATRCQILTLKYTKIDFGWGSAPDPAGGAYSVPPDPLAGFNGPTSKGRGGERRGEEGSGGQRREREGRGRSTCLPPRFDNPGYGPVTDLRKQSHYRNFKTSVAGAPKANTRRDIDDVAAITSLS